MHIVAHVKRIMAREQNTSGDVRESAKTLKGSPDFTKVTPLAFFDTFPTSI